ncbi:MAG: hypothetical protein HC857_07325 [Synechococcales cyanobacterium RU_4_20]|nr:hypothetical protein [Synechococcales cyanobacterium RU_4_20]NJR70672.1 hypothetical protein [Synechococcales cyanobacterium CRU_2_2]
MALALFFTMPIQGRSLSVPLDLLPIKPLVQIQTLGLNPVPAGGEGVRRCSPFSSLGATKNPGAAAKLGQNRPGAIQVSGWVRGDRP